MNKDKMLFLLLGCTLLRILKAAGTCPSGRVVEQDGKEFRVINEFPSNSPECKQVNGVPKNL